MLAAAVLPCAVLPTATTLHTHTAEHTVRLASDTSVHTTTMSRARLTLVGRPALAPLTRTDVRRVHTLRVYTARALSANRETLLRTQKTLLTTLTEHNSARVTLRGNLPPTCPAATAAPAPQSSNNT